MNSEVTLRKSAPLTPTANQEGCKVNICCPDWFDKRESYSVTNASKCAADLTFTGDDLNFFARVLYAESSGSGRLPDAATRLQEKTAIIHVTYFRINRKGYPDNRYIAKNFTDVCKAPRQFETVFASNKKFDNSALYESAKLNKLECADLNEALDAIKSFLKSGPNFKTYPYDTFLQGKGRKGWNQTGGTDFKLFDSSKQAMQQEIKE